TIPPRFGMLGPALRSLLKQTVRPEAVDLYIPRRYRRFPQWSGSLPDVPEGVRIVQVDEDLGPATKILPAARSYRGQDLDIIYVDDDRIFANDWARTCLGVRRDHPDTVICATGFRIAQRFGLPDPGTREPVAKLVTHPLAETRFILGWSWNSFLAGITAGGMRKPYVHRVEQSGFVDVAEGYGGVMVRPDFFDDEAFRIPPVAWPVDDIWLSGMFARRGVPIWADRSLYKVNEVMKTSRHFPLYRTVIDGADRMQSNRACIDHMRQAYRIWGGEATQST
nr:hypothetical protein [Tabrizicola sp.]